MCSHAAVNVDRQGVLILNIEVTDPRLDDEEREGIVARLIHQIRTAEVDLGDVRRRHAEAPQGAKSATTTAVIGALTALLSVTSLKPFFEYLTERWRGHEITMEIEMPGGRKLKLTARSREDLALAYNAAAALLAEKR